MKKIDVIVKDKTTLELTMDANKGDIIDLKELVQLDTTYLDFLIEEGKDKVYQSKLLEAKKAIEATNQIEINNLKNQIENLKKENITSLKIKEDEISKLYNDKIAALQKDIEVLKSNKKAELEAITSKNDAQLNKIQAENSSKYQQLLQEYNVLKSNYNVQINQNKIELEAKYSSEINSLKLKNESDRLLAEANIEKLKLNLVNEKDKEIANLKLKFDDDLKAKDDIINNLQRAKASMNVKQTGEDLEAWCDNEVTSYMQNGLFNCLWIKDNKVVKDEDELKGSKADYIFKIYASDKHLENELLASVCMDMKDENPDSINKKTNADYYKQLDKNRIKKNCKYALLVSNLEMDKPNVLPIFKVREYENMYVVRPAYLMVFLNMITSLTTRFSDLLLSKEIQKLQLKSKLDLTEEFEAIKKTYLDKPLELLEKAILSIVGSSETIKKACKNIDDQCEKINQSYIKQITEKLDKYYLKLNKDVIKKLEEEE